MIATSLPLDTFSNFTNCGKQTTLVFLNKYLSLSNYKTCFFFQFKSPCQLHAGNKQQEGKILQNTFCQNMSVIFVAFLFKRHILVWSLIWDQWDRSSVPVPISVYLSIPWGMFLSSVSLDLLFLPSFRWFPPVLGQGNLPCLFNEEATTGFFRPLFLRLLLTASWGKSELFVCAPKP